jgi:hypothetical protein
MFAADKDCINKKFDIKDLDNKCFNENLVI